MLRARRVRARVGWPMTVRSVPKPSRTPRKAKKPPRARRKMTAADKAAKHAHDYGPPGFVEWIREQPSVASGKGPCEAAHTEGRGAKLKGHWSTIGPLTREEHIGELHGRGRFWFGNKYKIDLEAKAAETVARWFDHSHGAP